MTPANDIRFEPSAYRRRAALATARRTISAGRSCNQPFTRALLGGLPDSVVFDHRLRRCSPDGAGYIGICTRAARERQRCIGSAWETAQ